MASQAEDMMIKPPAARRALIAQAVPQWNITSIYAHLAHAQKNFAQRPFVITQLRNYTYRDIDEWSKRLASGLIAIGLQPGEHVALEMANYPEFVALKFAIARAGAICIPINFLLRAKELDYVLRQSDANMLITMDTFRGHDYISDLDEIASGWRNDAPSIGQLRKVIVRKDKPNGDTSLHDLGWLEKQATQTSDQELVRREDSAAADALSDIIYTSGTTGRPKGVMLTHDMVLRAAYASALTRAFEDGRRILFALPMYHVFGYVECMIATIFVGGAIIPHAVFDPEETLKSAERHHASEMVCVPVMTTQLIELAKTRGFDARNFVAMFNSGGVNPETIWDEIRDHLGAKEILTAYGMTETTASTTCTLPEDDKNMLLTSNGRIKPAGVAGEPALSGATAVYKAIDPQSGADLPAGASGELVARGPIVTKGYYNKPEETEKAFTADGWLHTGDIGTISADGYLRLEGRIKESYRCGGEMVMPREVEEIYDNYPGVSQALIIGIPDQKMGEVGCLCIVASGTEKPVAGDLINHAQKYLARFKVPKHVVFLEADEIPLTPTGRPQKVMLRDAIVQRVTKQEKQK